MIVHVIAGLEVGGAEMALLNLLQGLPEAERKQHRVISLTDGGALGLRLDALGIGLATLGLKRGQFSLAALWQARQLVVAIPHRLLVGWMYHGNLLATLLAFLCWQPRQLLWSIHHSLFRLDDEKPLTRRIIRCLSWFSRLPRAIIYVSEVSAQQHEALGYFSGRRVIIPNGVDIQRFRPNAVARAHWRAELGLAPDLPVIVHNARRDPIKDHETFLAALATLAARGLSFHAVLVGAGTENLVAAPYLTCLGQRDDVPDLLAMADIFCLSSLSEAMPLSLAEALATGLPAVVTNVGQMPAMVGGAGLVVPPENPVALADALSQLILLPPRKLSPLARQQALAHYGQGPMVAAYTKIFSSSY